VVGDSTTTLRAFAFEAEFGNLWRKGIAERSSSFLLEVARGAIAFFDRFWC
jgi:hypothetical protein